MINQLRECIETHPGAVIIIGMGNRDRADDGVGLELAQRLKKRYPNRVFSEEDKSVEGIVFEQMERKDVETILFIDATDFGGNPGDVQCFKSEDAQRFVPSFSTHKVPITLLMEVVEQHGKKPLLLGIQPESLDFLASMSPSMMKTLHGLEEAFLWFFNKE